MSVSLGRLGESAPCQRLVPPLWPFHNPLEAAPLCSLFHNERRSPLQRKVLTARIGVPTRARSAASTSCTRACTRACAYACMDLKRQASVRSHQRRAHGKVATELWFCLYFLWRIKDHLPLAPSFFFSRLRSQAAKESFRPAFVRIPNHSARPSPWRDDVRLKDRLCLHRSNRGE